MTLRMTLRMLSILKMVISRTFKFLSGLRAAESNVCLHFIFLDEPLPCSGSDEVQPTAEQYEKFENIEPHYVNEMYFEGEHRVLFVPLDDVLNEVIQESKDINYAEQTHSDVVPGVYEGKFFFY